MATPSTGRPQLQPLGVLLPGTTTALYFRRDGRALWRRSGPGHGTTWLATDWTDTNLPADLVYEIATALTQHLQLLEQESLRISQLEQENAALRARLGTGV